MKKQYLQHGVMMLAVVSWFFIPHFFTGWPGVGVMAAVSIFCMVFYSKTRSWWPKKTLPDKLANKRANICLAISCIATLLYFFILLVSAALRKSFFAIVPWISVFLFIMDWITHIRVYENKTASIKVAVSLFLAAVTALSSFYVLYLGIYRLFQPFLPWISVIGCLSICLMAYITYQIPLRNSTFEFGWLYCACIAMFLTLLLNFHLGMDKGKIVNYVVVDRERGGMTCEMDTGDTFVYAGCPTPVGCTGRIKLHEGWFHIQYVEPIW